MSSYVLTLPSLRDKMGNKGKKALKTMTDEIPAAEPTRVKEILRDTLTNTHRRQGGDGESLPETPPNERSSHSEDVKKFTSNPFQIQVSVDVLAVILFLTGLATRFYKLDHPKHVV